jgi:DNA-binding IclR family transcriptional regulator
MGGIPVTTHEAAALRALRDLGLTQKEIAARTGRPLSTVEKHTTRGDGTYKVTTSADVEEMLSLAAEGLGRADIAAITGWSIRTVGKHVGHIVPRRDIPTPDIPRYRRMLKAAATAEYGMGDEIARRFGLKNGRVLRVRLVTARRHVAKADQEAA